MILPEQDYQVANRHGKPLFTTLTLPPSPRNGVPLLLILHGFKGFRNYSFLPWTAQHAASNGMAALRMCFSMNGMGNTSWLVQSTDDFARNTISTECDDVADLVDAVMHAPEFQPLQGVWNGQISLLGHSRGGGIAMIAARELMHSHPDRLKNVAVWNSVGTWIRWTPRQAQVWKDAGMFEMQNQRTMQLLQMNASYIDDIETNMSRLDLSTACAAIADRLRVVHAESDLTVPLREIMQLVQSCAQDQALRVIQQTTHTFGMEHPVHRITQGFIHALDHTFPWIGQ